jgi:hypothetical protein
MCHRMRAALTTAPTLEVAPMSAETTGSWKPLSTPQSLVGLTIGLTSVILAALLWSSRQLWWSVRR